MDIYEITGFKTGIERGGVNFLDPKDAFEVIENGYIYRQELRSRNGFRQFALNRLAGQTRVMGIFENIHPDGQKELLVIDKKYLYKYDSGTDLFVQVPFNARILGIDPAYNFAIVNPEDYVSGTSYFTKAGAQRFVFTGKGMSSIYFYNGVNVGEFTNLVDNPDYQAPASGALTKATNVIWFGERLNFFQPVIAAQIQGQAVLYSGIRNAAGNGDKFNVSGSGMLSADTYESMKGALIFGNSIIMNFQRSNWILDKTRDVFNPYFIKKIPSVLGTDATFSGVAWNYEVKSAGKTGMITTDGRQTLRFDDKVPRITTDDIDQQEFELVYGGFDRINSQFMFSYREADSELTDITQDKVLIYNYEEGNWAINDQRFSVFGQCDIGSDFTWDDIDETNDPSWLTWDTTDDIWDKIGIEQGVQKTLAGDNDGFVYELNNGYDDYYTDITNITQAAQAVLTVNPSAYKVKDRILIKDVEGMTEINDLIGTVVAATATSITVDIDSTLFTAYSGAGSISRVVDFRAEFSPFNPYRSDGRKCFVSHIEFLIDTRSEAGVDFEVYADEEETPFKEASIIPNSTNNTKAREWITVAIDQEASFLTFVLKKESFSDPIIITSIRVHAKAGSLNSN